MSECEIKPAWWKIGNEWFSADDLREAGLSGDPGEPFYSEQAVKTVADALEQMIQFVVEKGCVLEDMEMAQQLLVSFRGAPPK